MTMFLYNILTNLTEMMAPGSRRNGSALAAGGQERSGYKCSTGGHSENAQVYDFGGIMDWPYDTEK